MTEAGTGAEPEDARSPAGVSPQPTTKRSFEERSLAIPFRWKVAAVWIFIFLILGALFLSAGFDLAWMKENAWFIVKGLWVTILIAFVAILGAVFLALLGALGRMSRNPIAYGVSGFYTSFFRGTPLIVQMFLIYLALPQIATGLHLSSSVRDLMILEPVEAGTLALCLCYGAYMTEIFRAGIESVSHSQREAADALGMTYKQTMRRVVLPQATRVIIPPTGNEFIAMLKDTALVSFLGASLAFMETFRRAQLLGKADFRNLEALVLAAGMYWALTAIFTYFQSKLERKISKGYVRTTGTPVKLVSAAPAGPGGSGGLVAVFPDEGQPQIPDVPSSGDH